jgi:hypothetical protein
MVRLSGKVQHGLEARRDSDADYWPTGREPTQERCEPAAAFCGPRIEIPVSPSSSCL